MMDISRFLTDEQDPAVVQKLVDRVSQLLTNGEVIHYIGVQKRPVLTISPGAVVLTNFRFMIVRPTLTGMTFADYPWREVQDIHMSEQMLGATITCRTINGGASAIDFIPKAQARQIYTYAQEVEERAYAERRNAELERLRTSAGQVVVHNSSQPSQPEAPATSVAGDPLALLTQLKSMLDADLIKETEYDVKKAEILARM